MNRYVMSVVKSDGCAYSFRSNTPVFGNSPEGLMTEWKHALESAVGEDFEFKGVKFDFYTGTPKFLTLDDWFVEQI